MKIATWNINGVRARIDNLVSWLKDSAPDIVCLQEIKCQDDAFPRAEVEAAGYHAEVHGQKGFNGVALLSRMQPERGSVLRGLPGDDDDQQARYIEAVYPVEGGIVRVAGIYLPNGNPPDDPIKYDYKIKWMKRLETHIADRLALEEPFIVAGDYNVIPEPHDCWDPKVWEKDALFLPTTRQAFRRIENLGLTDAVRATTDGTPVYTFWDYQAGAWQKNWGIRIDHLLLSPEAADKLKSTAIEKHVRAWEKPSDHVPVAGYFDF